MKFAAGLACLAACGGGSFELAPGAVDDAVWEAGDTTPVDVEVNSHPIAEAAPEVSGGDTDGRAAVHDADPAESAQNGADRAEADVGPIETGPPCIPKTQATGACYWNGVHVCGLAYDGCGRGASHMVLCTMDEATPCIIGGPCSGTYGMWSVTDGVLVTCYPGCDQNVDVGPPPVAPMANYACINTGAADVYCCP